MTDLNLFQYNNPLIDKYNTSVDSLRLSIPLGQCELIEPRLKEKILSLQVFESTGEVISQEELKKNTYEIQYLDSSGKQYNSVKIWTDNKGGGSGKFVKGQTNPTLQIGINSKILARQKNFNYFNGLRAEYLEWIYAELMSKKAFYVSFDAFRKGRVYDVDVKHDFTLANEPYKELTNTLYQSAKTTTDMGGVTKFTGNDNIQFQSRDYSPNGRRYLKLYDKQLEAKEKSNLFFDEVFGGHETLKDIKRIETTIGGKKSSKSGNAIKKAFKTEGNTLEEVLSASQETLLTIITESIMQNTEGTEKVITKADKDTIGLSIQDSTILLSLRLLIEKMNYTPEDAFTTIALSSAPTNGGCKVKRSKAKSKARNLHKEYLTNTYEHQVNANRFLKGMRENKW